VITTCNRLNKLKKAVKSVENQVFLPNELIIVDDNSHDGTQEYCENLKEVSKIPIIYFRNNFRVGSNVCRNQAIERASGEYIAFLDDDDEWFPEKLRIQYETVKKENADLVYTGVKMTDSGRKKIYFHNPFPFTPKFAIMFGNFVGITSTMMIKSEMLKETGGFDCSIPSLQDYELIIRLINNNANVKGIKIPLVEYGSTNNKNVSVSSRNFFKASKIILKKSPIIYRPLQFIGLLRIFSQKLIKTENFRENLFRFS
jgi:glycosyltransferase involved in cell wall biosynthesis